nr:beta-galactosidase family protein [Roseateles oligotrophus]
MTISGSELALNGQPWRLLAGAIHYFRVLPEQWEDRLLKLRAMGLNTVETYVAWNLHEPEPGRFDFDGALDLVAFVRLAERLGLKVIVRPGPYICAEWEFGGLPAWLLADPDMVLRSSYGPYLAAVERFFAELLPRLLPLQAEAGGPILAMQVENEYGSYGSDQDYLRWLEGSLRRHGVTGLLFTSDGPTDHMLTHGTLAGVLKTGNFGSRVPSELAKLREYQPEGPLICMEFWNGWFDHWGEPHHTRDAADAADCLGQILAHGASVNIFMFHGGTSFGWMNGANTDRDSGVYQPTVNSYDYDAPLAEDGSITPKYLAMREAVGRHMGLSALPPLDLPPEVPRFSHAPLPLQAGPLLWQSLDLDHPVLTAATPRSMERLGQAYGHVLYRSRMRHPAGPVQLSVQALADRALVFLNGRPQGVLARDGALSLQLDWPGGEACLDLLVENQGRVNYGPFLHDRKGLLGWVRLGINLIQHWEHHSLPLATPPALAGLPVDRGVAGPRFFSADFEVGVPGDGFLAIAGGHKGQVWINGFNLGRYWERGPQTELYLPWPLLRPGSNQLVLLELEAEAGTALTASIHAQRPQATQVVDMAPTLAELW